jgi:AcrR family transcriptional regulator
MAEELIDVMEAPLEDLRERIGEIEDALLRECGERGYRQVTIAAVVERSGASLAQFEHLYDSLEDCYDSAYAARMGALLASLEERVRQAANWREGLRVTLWSLADFIEDDPALAAGLLVEVGVVGGGATSRRGELIAHCIGAVMAVAADPEASQAPSPLSAELTVYTVEGALLSALRSGEPGRLRAALPELAHMILAGSFEERIARTEARLVGEDPRWS